MMSDITNRVYEEPCLFKKCENIYRLTPKTPCLENGLEECAVTSKKSREVTSSIEQMTSSSISVDNINYSCLPSSSDTTSKDAAASVIKSNFFVETKSVPCRNEFINDSAKNYRYKNICLLTCFIAQTIAFLGLLAMVVPCAVILAGVHSELAAMSSAQSSFSVTQCKAVIEEANGEVKSHVQKENEQLTESIVNFFQASHVFNSCADIVNLSLPFISGSYYIRGPSGSAVEVYCSTGNGTAGWRRVAYINANASDFRCPPEFNHSKDPLSCRPSKLPGCTSVTFAVHGIKYTSITGRVLAWQYRNPDAFSNPHGHQRAENNIDGNYVDGISITHGVSPSTEHIWTFAIGIAVTNTSIDCNRCNFNKPDFVGSDLSCDYNRQCDDDMSYCHGPLWDDGDQCVGNATFVRQLPKPTTEDIDMRVCMDQDPEDEGIFLALLELYVR